MPAIKLEKIISVSSEDSNFKAENLLPLGLFVSSSDKAEDRMAKLNIYYP